MASPAEAPRTPHGFAPGPGPTQGPYVPPGMPPTTGTGTWLGARPLDPGIFDVSPWSSVSGDSSASGANDDAPPATAGEARALVRQYQRAIMPDDLQNVATPAIGAGRFGRR